MSRRAPDEVTVYVIRETTGSDAWPTPPDGPFVKIGFTRPGRELDRLAELQSGNARTLRIERTLHGHAPKLEETLHATFAHARRCGEWFALTATEIDAGLEEMARSSGDLRERRW